MSAVAADHSRRSARNAFAVTVVLATALGACERAPSVPAAAPGAAGPTEITDTGLLDYYVRRQTGRSLAEVDEPHRNAMRDALRRLQAAATHASGPDAAYAAEIAQLESRARSAAEAAGVFAEPSQVELATAYRAYVASLPASEFEVRHILVPTETLARDLISRLEHGEDFAALARAHSADDSAARGGSLGWIHAGELPALFTDAVQALQPGGYTREPVRTPFGWHVILLEARRAAAAPPPLEQVRAQLVTEIAERRYRRFLEQALAAP